MSAKTTFPALSTVGPERMSSSAAVAGPPSPE